MINYESILSAFDGKPTLLQWLKMVKKALDESVLKDITLRQDGASVIFTFNFEDGTSISTPAATLPKGDTGAKGDKGDKGEQGVSVTGVDEVSNEVVGSQTLTTLRFNFSNGTNNEVIVHAENGKSGGKLYKHTIDMQFADRSEYTIAYGIEFTVYGTTSETADTISKLKNLCGTQTPTCIVNTMIGDAAGVGYLTNLSDNSSQLKLHGYLGSWTPIHTAFPYVIYIGDTVTEL